MATWLVTGGCGFVGSHVAEALAARGDRVRILDDLSTGKRANAPAGAEVVVGDVADAGLVRDCMAGAAGCFHLAAIASVQRATEDWLGTHRANLAGTLAVFEAARPRRLPVVYASSAAVYGDNRDLPLKETAPFRALSAYGADKAACELHGRVAWEVHRIPTVGLRMFNIYGPRQDPKSPYSGVIAIFAGRIASGDEIEIHGDGGQTRDFVYVGDAVRFWLAAMAAARAGSQVFNLCTGRTTSVLELAQAIGAIAGKRPELRFGAARAGDIRASCGDPSAAAAALGERAETPVAEGLAATLRR